MPLSGHLWGVLTLVTPWLTSRGMLTLVTPGLLTLEDIAWGPLTLTLNHAYLKLQAYTPLRRALKRVLTLVISSINAGPVSASSERIHARCHDFASVPSSRGRAYPGHSPALLPCSLLPRPLGDRGLPPPAPRGSRDRLGPGLRP